jgi:hypothetical protein
LVEQTSCDGARVLSLMSCDVMSTWFLMVKVTSFTYKTWQIPRVVSGSTSLANPEAVLSSETRESNIHEPGRLCLLGHVWLAASHRTRLVGANFTPIGCLHRDLGLSRRMQKSTLALALGKRVPFPFPASQARCMRVGLQLMAVLARY